MGSGQVRAPVAHLGATLFLTSRLVNEGHGVVKRANRLIAYPAIARFLQQHIGAGRTVK
jgi:hypothetical protein